MPAPSLTVSPQHVGRSRGASSGACWTTRGALNVLLALGLRKEPVVEPVKRQQVTPEQDPVTKRWLKRTEETA